MSICFKLQIEIYAREQLGFKNGRHVIRTIYTVESGVTGGTVNLKFVEWDKHVYSQKVADMPLVLKFFPGNRVSSSV